MNYMYISKKLCINSKIILLMDEQKFQKIIEQLKSKENDCISFAKKYKQRDMSDLFNYYEGALWATRYALSLLSDDK